MDNLTQEERMIIAQYQQHEATPRHVRFYHLLLSFEHVGHELPEQDQLVLKKARAKLVDEQQRSTMEIINRAYERVKGEDTSRCAQLIAQMNLELEGFADKLYINAMEEAMNDLSAQAVAKVEPQLQVADIAHGSGSKTQWQKFADEHPATLVKYSKPIFDALENEQWRCSEDW